MPRSLLLRNAVAVRGGLVVAYAFWTRRPQWDPEMRLWKAVGDASLILLYATLVPDPLARLSPRTARLIPS
jgi:methionine sulfoxide reductase heme-binding subunit